MLSESDAEEMSARAMRYMMGFMVNNFSTFSDLKKFVPEETLLHPMVKTEVIPMKILFRDEKYISETIEIPTKLLEDAKLRGDPQVSTTCILNPHAVHNSSHTCRPEGQSIQCW